MHPHAAPHPNAADHHRSDAHHQHARNAPAHPHAAPHPNAAAHHRSDAHHHQDAPNAPAHPGCVGHQHSFLCDVPPPRWSPGDASPLEPGAHHHATGLTPPDWKQSGSRCCLTIPDDYFPAPAWMRHGSRPHPGQAPRSSPRSAGPSLPSRTVDGADRRKGHPLSSWVNSACTCRVLCVGVAAGQTADPMPRHKKTSPWRPKLPRGGCMSGSVLVSHRFPPAVQSALKGLTSGFGMEPGVSLSPWPPKLYGDVTESESFGFQRPRPYLGNHTVDA